MNWFAFWTRVQEILHELARVQPRQHCGLCYAIQCAWYEGVLLGTGWDKGVLDAAEDRMLMHAPVESERDTYYWPLDEAGDAERFRVLRLLLEESCAP